MTTEGKTKAEARIDRYDPAAIEKKWQERWEADALYVARDDDPRPKWYALTMFPYTSGDLHIGHWFAMAPSDTQARYRRMRGHNVMFPIGFDAFGLPAENAAIKQNIHPSKWTFDNVDRMRGQLRSMGASFDWSREVNTATPDYYRWTQWWFLQFLKSNLAYRALAPAWWCPGCQTVLANEQVVGDGECERCGSPVSKKDLEQWFFRITRYADELLDCEGIEWPEQIRLMQRNWIGRSEGLDVGFDLDVPGVEAKEIRVFTTRPDTIYGVTFMVLAPEHPLVEKITTPEQRAAVDEYVRETRRQSEIERLSTEKEKSGVFTGAYVTNRFNGERVPVWIADYVLLTYGTGAVMGVPAHDERDFAFALKYGLPVIPVLARADGVSKSFSPAGTMKDGFTGALTEAGISFEEANGHVMVTLEERQAGVYEQIAREHLAPGSWTEIVGNRWRFIFEDGALELDSMEADRRILDRCKALQPSVAKARTVMEMLNGVPFYRDVLFHTDYTAMIHSRELSGTPGGRAIPETIAFAEKRGWGRPTVTYRLRDWLISRQRYWGAPIPVVYCDRDGIVPVPESELPVLLPDDAEFRPTGESPLTYHQGFLNTLCPTCGGPARRETDTMDTFICSSWYQMRYVDPKNPERPFSREKAEKWLPVDQYTGGAEHAVMHLLYARFFTKAARDIGLLDHGEPFLRLFSQGQILGPDGQRMSKSRGNVIAPDEQVQKYGADTVRAYLMFLGPWDEGGPFDLSGISGIHRWLNRVWDLVQEPVATASLPHAPATRELRHQTHRTIRKVTDDIERFRFNTMLAALMEYTNYLARARDAGPVDAAAWTEAIEKLLLMLAPTAPHLAEEFWARTGRPYSIHTQTWPSWDPALVAEETVTLVVQVNGKVRDRLTVPASISEAEAREAATASEKVRPYVEGKIVGKVIYVPGRLVSIVVS